MSQQLYPQGNSPWYPLDRELGRPQSWSGHSKFYPYIDKIIWDYHNGLHNILITDQILCICQVLEKKMGVKWKSILAIYGLQESL
jgi:hypothetical protein